MHYRGLEQITIQVCLLVCLVCQGSYLRADIMHIGIRNLEQKTPIDLYKNCHSTMQLQSLMNAISRHDYLKHKVQINRNNMSNPITLMDG